jgi:isopenicillin-N epimerase
MPTRRDVVRTLFGAGALLPAFRGTAFAALAEAETVADGRGAAALADDDDFWGRVQQAFDVDRTMVNLNNGGISPAPTHVVEQMIRDIRFVNALPVEHNWRVLQPRMEATRRELAAAFGCGSDEMAVVRNASEALETMIFGVDLQRGDEVIVTDQNYDRMLTTWEQRERRDGIVLKRVSFPVPLPDDATFVRAIAAAITPRTKVIEFPHITNLTGQVLPVRDVVRLARPRGIKVFVDGAHAFAHFPFTRDGLECDFYGTSLHKWLHAPIGVGFLYVKREEIPGLWSLFGSRADQVASITKYEEIGTHPQANFNAVSTALAFHHTLGADRKIARLRWLRDRWAQALLGVSDRVSLRTALGPEAGGAIALVSVEGLDARALGGWLLSKHQIVTTPIVHPQFSGLRITPNIYTQPRELDVFVDRMTTAIRRGITA